ncbi:hypothetical protein D3C81_2157860 [compost metagenome]
MGGDLFQGNLLLQIFFHIAHNLIDQLALLPLPLHIQQLRKLKEPAPQPGQDVMDRLELEENIGLM